jgi:hypothetical protein
MSNPDTSFPMIALSIRQPFAHHILFGGKMVENRNWPTNYRGRILVHASLKFEGFADEKRRFLMDYPHTDFGGIVGMVEIVDCVTSMTNPWFNGPYGFVLRNPRPVQFMPCKGALGFFTPKIDFSQLRL